MNRPPKPEEGSGRLLLMPARPGTCPECATAHAPELPHNQPSLYYQYRFYAEHGRWPDWHDAMRHCSSETKAAWTAALSEQGIQLPPKRNRENNDV